MNEDTNKPRIRKFARRRRKYEDKIAQVLLDSQDEYLREFLTSISSGGDGYPMLNIDRKPYPVHIYIMGRRKGLVIDHINGNRLDSRRSNLRHVTQSKNMRNTRHRTWANESDLRDRHALK